MPKFTGMLVTLPSPGTASRRRTCRRRPNFCGYRRTILFPLLILLATTLRGAELPACTVQQKWLGSKTPLATPYYVMDSGQTGPVVLVVGGLRSDEAGSAAAEQISAWNVRRGKLIVVPQANRFAVGVCLRAVSSEPGENQRDMHHDFPVKSTDVPQSPLAELIWELVCDIKPDWLLELHEGLRPAAQERGNAGNSIVAVRDTAARKAAARMIAAANQTITATNLQFVVLKGPPIKGSLARAAGDLLGSKALILETLRTEQNLFLRTRQHRLMVHQLLHDLEMDASAADVLVRRNPVSIAAAIYDDLGSHASTRLDHNLASRGDMVVHRIGSDDVDAGVLSQFDVLIVPGGSGTLQARELGKTGRDAIRKFVWHGGGYVGTCAGAYLASLHHKHSLGILNATIADADRGKGTVNLEFNAAGQKILGPQPGLVAAFYHNGPVWGPGEGTKPFAEAWACFRTEITEPDKTPQARMIGSPALLAGRYGRGRVLCASPHIEATEGLEEMFRRMVRWAAGAKPDAQR